MSSRLGGPEESLERASRAFFAEVGRRGPLWALHRTARGEIGPAWLQAVFRLPIGGRLLASAVGFRIAAFLGPAVVAYLILDKNGELLGSGSYWQFALIGAVVLTSLLTSVVLFAVALTWTRATVFRRIARWSYEDLFWWSAILVVMPALAGAVLTAELVHRNVIAAAGVPATKDVPFRTFETFIWALLDSIPILKIPETLGDWKPTLTFTSVAGGSIVLAYKIFLVVPLTQLIGAILARAFGQAESTDHPPSASAKQGVPVL